MDTGYVDSRRSKAQMEFVGMQIAMKPQMRSIIFSKDALKFANGVSSYGQIRKQRKETEDFVKKKDSSIHMKCQTVRPEIRDSYSSNSDLFNGLKLNEN